MSKGMVNQKAAADSGYWPLYRFNPARAAGGENPLMLDSRPPKTKFRDFASREARFRMLDRGKAGSGDALMISAQRDIDARWSELERMARPWSGSGESGAAKGGPHAR
jgi:pyruvate-ferredoxin/flavodoxin oxidoreductase